MGGDARDATGDGTPDTVDAGTADARQAAGDDGWRGDGGRGDGVIHFHFPIDIQVVGGVDSGVVDAVVARVFDELRRELERSA